MSHSYVWHDSLLCVTWLIYMCDMTHWYVWHDTCICVTWHMHMCDMTHWYVWHDSFMCDMTRNPQSHFSMLSGISSKVVCVWERHELFILATWLIHSCDMTHSTHARVWHDSFMCVTWHRIYDRSSPCCLAWPIHMCGMTHLYARHNSFICVTWHGPHSLTPPCSLAFPRKWRVCVCVWQNSFVCVTCLIHACDITPSCCFASFRTSWFIPFLSLSQKFRSLLQKSPIKETIFCKRHLYFKEPTNAYSPMGWLRSVGSIKL